jgi:formylglycine-generating enzyme required for sulfatase activity
MSTPAPHVFVSHSSHDQAFAQRLAADLRQAGATAWIYEADDSAGNIMQRVNEMLAQCDWLVLVLSPDAVASTYVQTEVFVALNRVQQGRMRGVVPVVLRPVDLSHLPTWEALRRFPATSEAQYPAALSGVLRAITMTPGPLPPTARPVPPTPALPPLGPAPAPPDAGPAHHLTPSTLYNLGFRGYRRHDVEFVLPPLCPVPAGVFTMGSDKTHDKEAHDNEMPQYPVEVAGFAFGQYPVTVAEYACAVRAKAVREPPKAQEQLKRPDHPVVCVSWDDATAYAGWLAQASGQTWRLPSEAQWEKAARWDPAGPAQQLSRIYPWGDAFDKARCNTDASGIGTTTPVGAYPTGASPCGAHDLAGNVWEWTSSASKPYPYNAEDGRERANSTGSRVLRGGSWGYVPRLARAAFRFVYVPVNILGFVGLRVVLASPGSQL